MGTTAADTCPGGMRLRDPRRAELVAARLAAEGHPQTVHQVQVGGHTWTCVHPTRRSP